MCPKGLVALLLSATSVLALWPIPRKLSTGSTPLLLSNSFAIDLSDVESPPEDLKQAVARTQVQLKNDKLERLVVGRGAADVASLAGAKVLQKLKVSLGPDIDETNGLASISEETTKPIEERNEGYNLTIPADGSDASLSANSALGILRGLITFAQVWYTYDGYTYTVEAPFAIEDSPYYKWRGLLLDTARNFFPVVDIKRVIDGMSWTKINILHWHIVDSQSFPLALEGFLELAEKGAYSSSKQYTTKDLDEIVAYANRRGVDVMLEIDTPGHTDAIYHSHPEYIACHEKTPWDTYANEPPAGQLRFTETPVIDFVRSLFKAAVEHTPGPFFSTGGDEINTRCYAEDGVIQGTLNRTRQTLEQALDNFTQKTHAALLESGKIPVIWQEMVTDHQVKLDPRTVVLIWISSTAEKVADAGFRFVHASSDHFYLDCGGGGWMGNIHNGNSWCDPFKTWQKAYLFDPLANLTSAAAANVLGGQQLLWTEQSDPSNLDPILWPRAVASAEVFWTGPTHPNGGQLNVSEALARLHDLRYRYVQRGVNAVALQPEWCAVRPHACGF